MSTLLRTFYSLMLWATRLELALAVAAPVRNYSQIDVLQRDESEYEQELIQLELNL